MKQRAQCKQIFCPFIHPWPPDGVKRSKQVMMHIKLKNIKLSKFDLMHTPDIFGWVKRSDIEIVQISIF